MACLVVLLVLCTITSSMANSIPFPWTAPHMLESLDGTAFPPYRTVSHPTLTRTPFSAARPASAKC